LQVLTASAGIAGWIEFALLRRTLNRRIGKTGLAGSYVIKALLACAGRCGIGWGLKLLVGNLHPIPLAAVVLGGYGVTYFAITSALVYPRRGQSLAGFCGWLTSGNSSFSGTLFNQNPESVS